MPKLPGVNHLDAARALEKAGFRIARQGKHIVMTNDDRRIVTIPRHNPVNAFTMGGIVRDGPRTALFVQHHLCRAVRYRRQAPSLMLVAYEFELRPRWLNGEFDFIGEVVGQSQLLVPGDRRLDVGPAAAALDRIEPGFQTPRGAQGERFLTDILDFVGRG